MEIREVVRLLWRVVHFTSAGFMVGIITLNYFYSTDRFF